MASPIKVSLINICLYSGRHGIDCNGDVVSCHLRMGNLAGVGRKPDNAEFPMCHAHHSFQHAIGEAAFHGPNIFVVNRLCMDLAKCEDLTDAKKLTIKCRNNLKRID